MSATNKKYPLDMGWQVIAKDLNISLPDVLRYAQLPLDLLNRQAPAVSADEYYRLWHGLTRVMQDRPTIPLQIGQAISVEAFSPPLFASFCSPNLNVALERLKHYKPLVGPFSLELVMNSEQTVVSFIGLPENTPPPASLIAMELVFMVQLARLATRENIIPHTVYATVDIPGIEAYEDFFQTEIRQSNFDGLAFSAEDANRPFLTANERMWEVFEPELRQRLQDIEKEAGFRERVRACLIEILASGQYSMNDVAARLAVSSRTLQRRLSDENTNYQEILDNLREELARHYLSNSEYTSAQIAFLLGYQDPNSFFRAFRTWTGRTPEIVRTELQSSSL